MRKAPLVILAAALALTACGGPERGVVQDKSYRAAYTTWTTPYYSTFCSAYNTKTGACTSRTRVFHPSVPVHHPASWSMRIRNGEDEGWRSVPSRVWESCVVGQWYENHACSGEPGVVQDGGAW